MWTKQCILKIVPISIYPIFEFRNEDNLQSHKRDMIWWLDNWDYMIDNWKKGRDYEAVGRTRGRESEAAGPTGFELAHISGVIYISKFQNGATSL